ncbi:D-lactate dehydrogenase (cytochrome) [Oscillochloris trichoides DG-6]|uniref:D-lactate dehydrogenase (Cytochrome) n=1 Tax=Oscillochloris trichoides DG-6 TaxID=765420 RepID=E1IIF1_9CHLR|nr:FAD-linked oxidase C-terminal domain-containing protein [Oscillochloris trichoides]EFO79026.1 D-lactate dehydrogenase (cytochrome) [Oscillochloris trichoides DG-6]
MPDSIQPAALLVQASAQRTLADLNAALADHGLWLPIAPLRHGLTLGELVAQNVGGRYRLAYGPVGRYLRAATRAKDGLILGGPTLKWATGYGLHRVLAADGVGLGSPADLTFSLRPLPASYAAWLLEGGDVATLCRLAARLVPLGLTLRCLALAEEPDGRGTLLAELAGPVVLVERHAQRLVAAAHAAAVRVLPAPPQAWARWEALAQAQVQASLRLELTLPRVALPAFAQAARTLARRSGLPLTLWGDAGVGAIYLHLAGPATATGQRLLALLAALAQGLGGARTTELGAVMPVGATHVAHAQPQQATAPTLILTRPEEVAVYSRDASIAQPQGMPLAVALPTSTEAVVGLMHYAARAGVPVIARGAGSGLAGGTTSSAGALVVAMSRMQRIRIDAAQMVAHVQAGAVTAEVQRMAEAHGLFYPPDPSSHTVSTIGGNIACNAGGPRCVKYGVTADYVLGLRAVLADGSLVEWGDGLAGQGGQQSLAQLLVGSEGTLALITEATLRLLPLPAARRTTLAAFRSTEAACATVAQIMAAGLVPGGLELMDATCIAAVEAYLGLGLPRDAGAILLMLADGEADQVEAESQALAALAQQGGAIMVQVAAHPADEARLWRGRRAVAPALARIRPRRLGEDICVPLPQIAPFVARVQAISAAYGLPIAVFGHAGDGNLHPNILFDPQWAEEMARLWPCAEAIFGLALELGGTLSGEHGIGTLKRPFLERALGRAGVDLQQQIKVRFDPQGYLNPGKIVL